MACTKFSVFVLLAVLAALAKAQSDKYTTKYDDVNVDDILGNKRLLNQYTDCVLDAGTCTAEGKQLKELIPEALADECKKCNDKQKETAAKVLKHLYEKEQELFKKLEAKYDPEGKYKIQYKAAAAKEGITL